MRLIDADKTIEDLKKNCIDCNSYDGIRCRSCWVDDARLVLEDALDIDAVPVVRCKDCKHRGGYNCPMYHTETSLDDLDGFDDYNVDRTDGDGF